MGEIGKLDVKCATGVYFLLGELTRLDPDADERCGLVDLRHEVYAARIPGCGAYCLALSVDRKPPERVWLHGIVSAAGRPCANAYRLVCDHLNLAARPWEPAR